METKKLTREDYEHAVATIEAYKKQLAQELEDIKSEKNYSSTTNIDDTKISCRLRNALAAFNNGEVKKFGKPIWEVTLGDLSKYSEIDYLKTRTFGKKSLDELRDLLLCAGFNLKKQ